jgi:hypothetical protein
MSFGSVLMAKAEASVGGVAMCFGRRTLGATGKMVDTPLGFSMEAAVVASKGLLPVVCLVCFFCGRSGTGAPAAAASPGWVRFFIRGHARTLQRQKDCKRVIFISV